MRWGTRHGQARPGWLIKQRGICASSCGNEQTAPADCTDSPFDRNSPRNSNCDGCRFHTHGLCSLTHAAIASKLAADIYGLNVLRADVQDADHNTTRFLILSRDAQIAALQEDVTYITSFIFRVRNIPAALYKALGGFATNSINMVKLESYVNPQFQVAQFYADVVGHPESRPLQLAMEELGFFAKEVSILGTYKAHPFRKL